MGNNLCKERINNASNSKNPIDRLLGRCAQLCPNSAVRKDEHAWNKHIYETRPPERDQPRKFDSWRNVTLNTADNVKTASSSALDTPPVVPPRKKRPSMLGQNKYKPSVKNGFKDVFGSDTPARRYSCDSVDTPAKYRKDSVDSPSSPVRNTVSCYDIGSDDFSDFSKDLSPKEGAEKQSSLARLPKCGNRKSDKFFGENLSDCLSDESYLKSPPPADVDNVDGGATSSKKAKVEPDAIEKFVEENKPIRQTVEVAIEREEIVLAEHEPLSKTDSLDRKAEFLMAMLDGYNNNNNDKEISYEGRQPVEEPIIVPKRRHSRHICDDDEHIHEYLHHHDKKEEEKQKENGAKKDEIVSPKKPLRDFTKYRKSLESVDTDAINAQVNVETKKPEDIQLPTMSKDQSKIEVESSKKQLTNQQSPNNIELSVPQLNVVLTTTKINKKPQTPPPPIPLKPASPATLEPPKVMQRIISMPDATTYNSAEEKAEQEKKEEDAMKLKKCKSSNSFLTNDLMDHIKKKVYEFQISSEYCPEDSVDNQCDGSDFVTPSSKLEKRKTSATKKISNASTSSSLYTMTMEEDELNERMKFSIGSKEVKVTNPFSEDIAALAESKEGSKILDITKSEQRKSDIPEVASAQPQPPTPPTREKSKLMNVRSIEEKKDIGNLPVEENIFNQMSRLKAEDSLEHILENSDLDIQTITNVLDDIYKSNKSVLEDFQQYLENETADHDESKNQLEKSDKIVVTSRSAFDEETKTNLNENVTVKDDDANSSGGSISDDDFMEMIKDVPKDKIFHRTLIAMASVERRRDSIEDMETWFTKHTDTNIIHPHAANFLQEARRGRRGSDFMIGYDTNTVFPFGQRQKDRIFSESSEFFENSKISRSVENLRSTGNEEDHSKLLKFIKKEKIAAAAAEISSSPASKTTDGEKKQ